MTKVLLVVLLMASFSPFLAKIKKPEDIKCKNILLFFGVSTKSQEITFMPLAKSLAEKCHKITVIMVNRKTGGKSPISTHENIKLKLVNSDMDEFAKIFIIAEIGNGSDVPLFQSIYEKTIRPLEFYSVSLDKNIEASKEILDSKEKFDLVILNVFPSNEVAYYLAYRLGAPTIMYSTYQGSLWFVDQAMGANYNPSLAPSMLIPIENPMNFFERLLNTVLYMFLNGFRNYWYMNGPLERRIKNIFKDDPKDRPSVADMEKNVSLALQFGHPIISDGFRPVAPNHIMIGMMNCKPTGRIKDENLLKFVESEAAKKHGIIVVSFGSVITAALMAQEKKMALLSVFEQLKQQIVWKWEEDLPGKPSNVFISDWLPQKELLNHPNTILMVNHGGQSSIQESWCFKKPMVVVSVFGDQPINGREVERSGTGIHISFKAMNKINLLEAINKVLADDSFQIKSGKQGELLMDQIQHPLEKAVWWVEYVLRHPDHKLKTTYHDLKWWQYQLLDVYAFLMSVIFIVIYVKYKILRSILYCGRSRKLKKSKTD